MKILNMIGKLLGIREVYWFGGEGKPPTHSTELPPDKVIQERTVKVLGKEYHYILDGQDVYHKGKRVAPWLPVYHSAEALWFRRFTYKIYTPKQLMQMGKEGILSYREVGINPPVYDVVKVLFDSLGTKRLVFNKDAKVITILDTKRGITHNVTYSAYYIPHRCYSIQKWEVSGVNIPLTSQENNYLVGVLEWFLYYSTYIKNLKKDKKEIQMRRKLTKLYREEV